MPELKPLNQIIQTPQQPTRPQNGGYTTPQPQQQPAFPQPVAQQPAPAAPGQMSITPLQDTSQLSSMQNNGRVEVVIQDRTRGHFVISADQLNINELAQQTGNVALAQELSLFDNNRDGWLVEGELKNGTWHRFSGLW